MLDSNRYIHKKLTAIIRVVSLLLPIVCVVLLLSQVVFAKNTYVINDGDRVLVHTTYTTNPAEVLTEAGLELGEDDTYTTQEGIGVSEITVQRTQVVGVVYNGQCFTVSTYGGTVASILEKLEICLNPNDVVSVSLDTKTFDGMTVVIDRCVSIEETYTVSVPYDTYYVLDTALPKDGWQVLQPGMEGQVQNVDAVSYVNGSEINRVNQLQTVVTAPVDQIVAVGTLDGIPEEQIVQADPVPERPEATTGNGQLYIGEGLIITPDGQILTYTDTLQVVATAYHNSDPGCTIYTAIGTYCRVGAIAVDPRVIPYGTRMYIVTNDGQYIYGIAVAEDCGGSIKGNRVDLYFDTVDECWTFGIRDATVYFLG